MRPLCPTRTLLAVSCVLFATVDISTSSNAAPLSLDDFPELMDLSSDWWAEISARDPAPRGTSPARGAPPIPADFLCTLLIHAWEGGVNASLAGDGFVAGSRGKVRLEGLYHMQAGRRSQTAATTMIIVGSTNTVIMDDPALPQGAAPRCRIYHTQPAETAGPGIDLGFVYMGTRLARIYFRRTATVTTWTFVDAYTSAPVSIVDRYSNGDQSWVLYGNVQPGPIVGPIVPESLVAPPAGIRCTAATDAGSGDDGDDEEQALEGVDGPGLALAEALLKRTLGVARLQSL